MNFIATRSLSNDNPGFGGYIEAEAINLLHIICVALVSITSDHRLPLTHRCRPFIIHE